MSLSTRTRGALSGLLLILTCLPILTQSQVTAVTQVPSYSLLNSCAANIIHHVIDLSLSAQCPAGSKPSCYCDDEGSSAEYASQISTNIVNNCLTSASAEATLAVAVFSSYCVLGASSSGGGGSVITTTDSGGSVVTTTAGGQTGSNPTTSSSSSSPSGGGGGYTEDQKIALGTGIGIGVPTFILAVVGIWVTIRYMRR